MRRFVRSSSICIALLFALFVLGPASSHAISIGFDPMVQDILLGNQAMVDLVISDLGVGMAPSLGEFDLTIGFDPSILALNTFSFGDQLDILGLGSLQISFLDDVGGTLDLYELSFDFSEDLDFLQADSFVLASLTFDTLAPGTSYLDILPPFGLMEPLFGDALGDPLDVDLNSGSITVVQGTEPIPEPATILLMGAGLIGVAGGLRRRFR